MTTPILFVIRSLSIGGAEQHLLQVLPALKKLGYRPTVYTLSPRGTLAHLFELAGVTVFEPMFTKSMQGFPSFLRVPTSLLMSPLTLCVLLLRLRPSLIHFFLPHAYLLGGICSLFTGRRVRVMSRRSLNTYQDQYPVLARVERWLHPRMNAILGNSKAVVRQLKLEGISPNRLGLLYNGIDLSQFNHLPTRTTVRQSLGLNDQTLLLVCVANLIPYKGHADLLNALGEIRHNMPDDWAIAIVGRDNGIGFELRQLASDLGIERHVLWLGERVDAVAIYAAAEIGVLSSHQEGFSNSVLEGMAASVAMVVTDVGGNGEAVLDGHSGTVVPSRNPKALGVAILALAQDENARLRMANSARQRVLERFSLQTCVVQYAALYRALLRDPRADVQACLDEVQAGPN
jgi:glycosyltransferase involved in cell wall biosynthesis